MSIRDQMKSKAAAKISKLRAMNNEHKPSGGARKSYAAGGEIEGGDIGGAMAKPSLSRPGRGKPGKGKGTNVNVIVMPHAPGAGGPPGGPIAGGGPAMPMPPPGVGGPPMGAGDPPMSPMMGRKTGGRVHMTAGAQSGVGRLEKEESMKKKGK